jgi:hypothetical protein
MLRIVCDIHLRHCSKEHLRAGLFSDKVRNSHAAVWREGHRAQAIAPHFILTKIVVPVDFGSSSDAALETTSISLSISC